MTPRLCQIYRSPLQQEMYLYVDAREGISKVPDKLLKNFGKPEPTLSLLLTVERRLARAEAAIILQSIAEKGYYLQLPPQAEQRVELQLRRKFGQ